MKLRLHEIELGCGDVEKAASFYTTILEVQPQVQQQGLTVFDAGVTGFDFNVSTHYPPGVIAISFLTDDLKEIEKRLQQAAIIFDGPSPSHLGMSFIQFKDPNGYLIKVNMPTAQSPEWLKV